MERSVDAKATLGRLPIYLEFLKGMENDKDSSISATNIAKRLGLGEVQVRKDLNAVSGGGRPKIGYDTKELIKSLEKALGVGKITHAVLVGAGKLGRALLDFDELEKYGVQIAAAFDSNQEEINIGHNKKVLPMNQFKNFCKKNNIQIGIITVGVASAQEVCNIMIDCGISAIWNFAPCKLNVPNTILLKQENLALSLAHLNSRLCNKSLGG